MIVYLTLKETDIKTPIPSELIPLINARNEKNGFQFVEGDTWEDLRTKYTNSPTNGGGVYKKKNGEDYWYLPFEDHEAIESFPELEVLSRDEVINYGWDVEDIEI